MIRFFVTIDTEEEREWGSDYLDHKQYTVKNIEWLPALQDVFNKHGVIPTYLIDYPVAASDTAVDVLKSFQDEGVAEIGAHLHPWVNPPYEEERTVANTFPSNLNPALQQKKMQVLTDRIAEAFGQAPLSYRAGRYGFDHTTIPILEQLGYKVDSSVVPFRKRKKAYEPEFGYLPSIEPYRLNAVNVKAEGATDILEVPVTVGFNRTIPTWLEARYIDLPNIGLRRILKKAADIDLYWLRPSYANLKQMLQLSDAMIAKGATFLNMMFHSNELMPGGSKYCDSQQDVNAYLDRLDAYFAEMNARYSIDYQPLKQSYALYCQSRPQEEWTV